GTARSRCRQCLSFLLRGAVQSFQGAPQILGREAVDHLVPDANQWHSATTEPLEGLLCRGGALDVQIGKGNVAGIEEATGVSTIAAPAGAVELHGSLGDFDVNGVQPQAKLPHLLGEQKGSDQD